MLDGTHSSEPVQEIYGPAYYASHCGNLIYGRQETHWSKFFGAIATHIVGTLSPSSVFDAGCAHGFLLEALYDRGVQVSGRDISSFAISQVREDIVPFVERGNIANEISGFYDLITCIEVLEHLPEQEALRAIAAMCSATDQILLSSSPSDLVEPTHINVQSILWWLQRFSEVGFAPVVEYDASFVTAHAYLLRRSPRQADPIVLEAFAKVIDRRVRRYERRALAARIFGAVLKPSKLAFRRRGVAAHSPIEPVNF